MFKHIKTNLPKLEDITDPITGIRHYLCPDGNRYPSITTVLKSIKSPALENWKKRVGEEKAEYIRRTTADDGKQFHKLCEHYLNNKVGFLQDFDPFTQEKFHQLKKYINKLNNIHAVEKQLYSPILKIAGSCDIIGEFDNILAIVDFKPNNSPKYSTIYPGALHKYYLQTNGYSRMYEYMTGTRIDRAVILVASTYHPADCIVNDDIHQYDGELDKVIENYYRGLEQ